MLTNDSWLLGAMVSWLACSTPNQAAWGRALVGVINLCSWVKDTFLSLCLSPPRCITGWTSNSSRARAVEILLVTSCYRNRKCLSYGPLGFYADFTFPFPFWERILIKNNNKRNKPWDSKAPSTVSTYM